MSSKVFDFNVNPINFGDNFLPISVNLAESTAHDR